MKQTLNQLQSDKHKIKLLVVDDSAFMRSAISMMVRDEDDIEIVAQGKNGLEAIELTKKHNPDIITLDIEMPKMDGLEALGVIMKECPTPVVMISSLTTEGAESTLKAFELGAVDFISKEMSFVNVDITKIKDDLIRKLRHFAKNKKSVTKSLLSHRTMEIDTSSPKSSKYGFSRIKVQKFNLDKGLKLNKSAEPEPSKTSTASEIDKIVNRKPTFKINKSNKFKVLCIGTSTGGPIALQHLIPLFPKDFPVPIVIVQHMPPNFTKSLAMRLDTSSQLNVREATLGEEIQPGNVYVAPGGKHLTLKKEGAIISLHLSDNPYGLFHKPSVDVMMSSAANFCKENILSVILTGMGKDGLEGIRRLKSKGAYVIAQDEATCIVYGMPKVVIESNLADDILPLDKIKDKIMSLV